MKFRKKSGIGLLEMMIAILISLVILSLTFRYTYFMESSLSKSASYLDMIEKYHVIFAWMLRDVEMAGYLGCVKAKSRSKIIDDHAYLLPDWLTAKDNRLSSQYMSPEAYLVLENKNNQLLINGKNFLKENDIVVIENCWQAQIAKIKKISSVNYGAQNRLSFYDALIISDAHALYVARLVQHTFFIKKTSRKNKKGDFIYSLYVNDINTREDEVLENINKMTLKSNGQQVNMTLISSDNNKPLEFIANRKNE
jgi:hypothetical protein